MQCKPQVRRMLFHARMVLECVRYAHASITLFSKQHHLFNSAHSFGAKVDGEQVHLSRPVMKASFLFVISLVRLGQPESNSGQRIAVRQASYQQTCQTSYVPCSESILSSTTCVVQTGTHGRRGPRATQPGNRRAHAPVPFKTGARWAAPVRTRSRAHTPLRDTSPPPHSAT
jgi:hypothetical protein